MPARTALLIDDEPLARIELRRLLQAHPDVTIVGEAATVGQARERLATPDYDLVFLDVQLRGGSGFDLLDGVRPAAQIVFITAYDRYAVRAFEVNALDYLLKPVTAERLAASLHRGAPPPPPTPAPPPTASPVDAPAGVESPETPLTLEDRVYIKSGHATRFVPVTSIVSVCACENYTELRLTDGSLLLALRTLKSWATVLPPQVFLRIHRQSLVNLAHVKAIVRGPGDDVRFQFVPDVPDQPASRRRLAELRQRFTAAGLDRLLP